MSSEESVAEKVTRKTTEVGNSLLKGEKAFHTSQGYKYVVNVKTNSSSSCVVSILDTTVKNAKGKPSWFVRFDKPHAKTQFNHINVNQAFTGVKDPHIKLPPGGLVAAETTAKVAKVANKINKVAIPIAIAVDTATIGYAVYKDSKTKTTRNTAQTVASVAGGWGAGYGGALGGAALGSMICPGIGTIIGGFIGGIGGGFGGSLGAGAIVDAVGDGLDYDMEWRKCEECGKRFKARKYKGEKICQSCKK